MAAMINNDAIFDYFNKSTGDSLSDKFRRHLERKRWRLDPSSQAQIKLQLEKKNANKIEGGKFIGLDDDNFSSDSCSPTPGEKLVIEKYLSGSNIMKIKNGFCREMLHCGGNSVTKEKFVEIVKNAVKPKEFPLQDITNLFSRCDVYNQGYISWENFMSYLGDHFILSMSGIDPSHSIISFSLPPKIMPVAHKISTHLEIVAMMEFSEDSLLTVSVNGVVVEWNLNHKIVGLHFPDPKTFSGKKFRALSACVIQLQYRLIIGTASHELYIYTVKPVYNFICKIGKFQSVAITLNIYTKTDEDGNNLLCFGDIDGCINCFRFKNLQDFVPQHGESSVLNQCISIDQLLKHEKIEFFRWKVHSCPVNEIRYFDKLNSIASCSNDKERSLVLGSIAGKKRVGKFHINLSALSTDYNSELNKSRCKKETPVRTKSDEIVIRVIRGVDTFDYSESTDYFATGGIDKVVRIWNVNSRGCAELVKDLLGHRNRFNLIKFHETTTRHVLISVSEDKDIRIWDSFSFQLVYTLQSYDYIMNEQISLKGAMFNDKMDKMYILSDSFYTLQFAKLRAKRRICNQKVHESTVNCVIYRSSTNTVITGDQNGIIKMWDLSTGNAVGEFYDVNDELSPVTSLLLDYNDVRLMSSHEDGLVRVWNLNSFQCVKVYTKNNTATVTKMAYVNFNQFRWLVTTGWDRQLHFYSSLQINHKRYQDPIFTLTDKAYYPYEGIIIMKGHIQCMVEINQSKLVIGSDDGEIHIWDVLVRKMIKCLVVPPPTNFIPDTICHASIDLQIHQMLVLWTREKNVSFNGAVFLTLGPYNMIHFWTRLISDGRVIASFFPTIRRKTFSSCMDITLDDLLLYTGDGNGNVTSWSLRNYASTTSFESDPPAVKLVWNAHKLPITDIKIIYSQVELLITASADSSIRLWKLDGNLLGVFGKHQWIITDSISELRRNSTTTTELDISESIAKSLFDEVSSLMSGDSSGKSTSMRTSESLISAGDSIDRIIAYSESELMKLKHTMVHPINRHEAFRRATAYVKDRIHTGVYHTLKLHPENGKLTPITITRPSSLLVNPKRHRRRLSLKQSTNTIMT